MNWSARNISKFLVLAAAFAFAAMYFFTALPRIVYPFDLDFEEDSVLMEALRFGQGQAVYIAPNAVFNPHVYMPLYFWVGGVIERVTGPGLTPLRLLSLAAILVTTGLIFWIARRETEQNWIALACAGLFLGGYRISGFWYELARVDSLFVALMVGGLALGIYAKESKTWLVFSALVLALAFFTKQTGGFIGIGLGIYLIILVRRSALWFIIPFAILTLVPLFLFNALTGGWFFYHIFFIGSADPIEIGRIVNFVLLELVGVMGALLLMAVIAGVWELRAQGLKIGAVNPWLVAMVFAVLISGLGRARVGGNLNNRLPAYALLCLAPAILYGVWGKVEKLRLPFNLRVMPQTVIALAILVQFALGAYNPLRYLPTAGMRASGGQLIERIRANEGPVFVMMHPYYALLAGKETSTQIATLWYVRDRGALPFPDDFVNRLQSKYYTEIISDESDFETEPALRALLDSNYQMTETLTQADAPATDTGVVVRPMSVYRPK